MILQKTQSFFYSLTTDWSEEERVVQMEGWESCSYRNKGDKRQKESPVH